MGKHSPTWMYPEEKKVAKLLVKSAVKSAVKENKIQADIVKYLQGEKIFCHSVPNELGGDEKSRIRMTQFVAMGLRSGVADMVVWWPKNDGVEIAYLEVKTAIGKQSQAQETFERKCNENGIRYDLVRSVEDVAIIREEYR